MSSGPSSSGSEGTSDRPTELIALLDSENAETVEQTKAIIHENLYKSRDTSLLNALVDCYLETRSTTALQILTSVHEARIHNLFEKLNDCFKHCGLRGRIDTMTLLGHIVRRQPSWLYKIVKAPLFETVIKSMKSESDVLYLMNGALTITTLLPIIASYVESWLNDVFEVYTRLAGFLNSRPGNIPDIYLLHLHVSVYFYFHRIYAMYPNNFIAFLRGYCHNNVRKQIVFQTIIKPMLERVRLHPCLITETAHSETGKHRWRKKEPQDIAIECENISLDPLDRLQSDSSLTTSWASLHDALTLEKSVNSVLTSSEDQTREIYDIPRIKERRMSDSATQTGKSLQSGDSGTGSIPLVSSEDYDNGWSPTEVCALSTPPSSHHMSPAMSSQDLVAVQTNPSISQCNTSGFISTPGDSPTSSLADDLPHNSPALLKNRKTLARTPSGKSLPSKAVGPDSLLIYRASNLTPVQTKADHTKATSSAVDNQTSTPKSETSMIDLSRVLPSPGAENSRFNFSTYERQISELSIQSEPITPIEKAFTYDYTRDIKPEHEMQEQLTCSDHDETNDNAAKEIKRILSQNSFTALQDEELPENPPPSLDVSLVSDGVFSTNGIQPQELQHINLPKAKFMVVSESEDTKLNNVNSKHSLEEPNLMPYKSESKTTLVSHSSEMSEGSRTHSVTPTPQDDHQTSYDSETLAMLLNQKRQYQEGRQEHDDDCKRCLTPRPTPIEILDNYIQIGSGVHLNELSRISLVSSPETDWTHFGGDAPVDEITILRGQIQLLHFQVLYERHKCYQHAIRNRRLIGKTFKVVQYQEELLAIKDHLRLQEEKMRELNESLMKQTEHNSKFKEITSGWDNQQQTQLRNLLNENAKLQHDKKMLKETLENQKKERDCLLMKLHHCESKIFTLQNEIDCMKPKLAEKSQLKSEIERLTKELVVMGELNQHHREMMEKAAVNKGKKPEASLQFYACQKELTASKQMVRKQKAEIDALHSKVSELEKHLMKKDAEMKELRKFSESLNGIYLAKHKALEEKYTAQKKINQSLEAHILNLQLALEDTKHESRQHLPGKTKARPTSSVQDEMPTGTRAASPTQLGLPGGQELSSGTLTGNLGTSN